MSGDGPVSPRLAAALPLHDPEPVIAVHGPGVADKFIGVDYQLRSFEEAIWAELHRAGFERIVFADTGQPIYFLDERSRRLSGEVDGPDDDPGADLLGGPNRTMKEKPPPSMTDSSAVKMMDHLMGDPSVQTALVVTKVENYLSHHTAEREFADVFANWTAHKAHRNLCVLAFTTDARNDVVQVADRNDANHPLVDHLRVQAKRGTDSALRRIGPPDDAELSRLLDTVRIVDGLRLADWAERDLIVRAMAAQRNVPAAQWHDRLVTLAARGIPLSPEVLREQRYVATLPGGVSARERLDQLVGLDAVKDRVRRVVRLAEVALARQARGYRVRAPTLHTALLGGPGTGKTTVAELLGELYREAGFLRSGHLHAPTNLIGAYVGSGVERMEKAIEEALDGVLFIDEAYTLVNEANARFGRPAIDQLVGRMEPLRDRLVVVVAGYPKPMAEFLTANDGLGRRFPEDNRIKFPDYGPDDLMEILDGMRAELRLEWAPGFEPTLRRVVEGLRLDPGRVFGNAGDMRNLIESLDASRADRVGTADLDAPVTADDLTPTYRVYLE